jgi:hypothetical protein
MDLPIEDVIKVSTGGAGGLGLMAFFMRYLKGDLRRSEAAQSEVNRKVWKKCDEIAQSLVDHRIEDAKTYVSRDEFSVFRAHMDDQFEKTRNMIFDTLKGN